MPMGLLPLPSVWIFGVVWVRVDNNVANDENCTCEIPTLVVIWWLSTTFCCDDIDGIDDDSVFVLSDPRKK